MLVWRRFRYGIRVFITLAALIVAMTCLSSLKYWQLTEKHLMDMREQRLAGLTRYVQEYVDDALVYPDGFETGDRISLLRRQLAPILERLTSANPDVVMGLYLQAADQVVIYAPLHEYSALLTARVDTTRYRAAAGRGDQFLRLAKETGEVTSYIAPLILDGQPIGTVFADEPIATLLREKAEHLSSIWLHGLITILIGLSVSLLLTASLSKNIIQLVSGIRRMAHDRNHRLPVSSGEFGEIAHAINDLTRSLTDNQQLLHTLLTHLPMGVVVIDHDGVVGYFNRTAQDYMHLSAEDVVGKPVVDLFPQVSSLVARVLVQGEELRDQIYRGQVTDTHDVALRIYGTPLRNQQGEIIGAIGLFADITASDRLEQANQQLLNQIHQAEKLALVGELAAGTAHEVRNPLMVIQGFIQMVHDRLDHESAEREWLQLALSEVEHIKEITNEFLVLANPTAPQRVPTDMLQVIRETLQMVDSTAYRSGVKIRAILSAQNAICSADGKQLKQVFLNLFTNAIQAMPQGGELTVEIRAVDSGGRMVVSIHDTGSGIDPTDLPRIFDPYYSRGGEGTGLGLTVAARIVQDHGGTIEVKSEPGVGSVFTVTLPAKQI